MTTSTSLPGRTEKSHTELWWLILLALLVLALWFCSTLGQQPPTRRSPDGIPWLNDDRHETCRSRSLVGCTTGSCAFMNVDRRFTDLANAAAAVLKLILCPEASFPGVFSRGFLVPSRSRNSSYRTRNARQYQQSLFSVSENRHSQMDSPPGCSL